MRMAEPAASRSTGATWWWWARRAAGSRRPSCCVRRGARVTLSEIARVVRRGRRPCAAAGVQLETGGHQPATLAGGRSRRGEPGCAARAAGVRGGARARRRDHRRARAGVAVARRARDRGHRHQGQVHDDDAHRPDAERRRAPRARRRQHRRAAAAPRSRRRPTAPLHVVEVSSFQLETTTTFRPWIAVWLNLTDDHLDRHASLQEYGDAKARIFANQVPSDFAVVNADDPAVVRYSGQTFATRVWFSLSGRVSDGYMVSDGWIGRTHAVGVRAPRAGGRGASCRAAHAGQRRGRDGGGQPRRRRRAGHGAGGARLPRARARDGAGGGHRQGALRERLEGDQRRAPRAVDRELRLRRRGDRRRPLQGRRPRRAEGRAGRPRARRWWRSARRRRWWKPPWQARCRWCGPGRWPRPSRGPTTRRDTRAWCCWRRRARASTGSATTPSAARSFKEEVARLKARVEGSKRV